MSFRLHKFVLALCVTLCLAVALWPKQPPAPQAEARRPSSIEPGPPPVEPLDEP